MTPKEKRKLTRKWFGLELTLIQNTPLRTWTVKSMGKYTSDYFWTAPASSSGRYHPDLAQGPHGLIRHTKFGVYFANEFANAFNVRFYEFFKLEELRGMLISALILHDAMKSPRNVPTHGAILGNKILDELDKSPKGEMSKFEMVKSYIGYGIGSHMGKWSKEADLFFDHGGHETLQLFQDLVHLADYCASRKIGIRMQNIVNERRPSGI